MWLYLNGGILDQPFDNIELQLRKIAENLRKKLIRDMTKERSGLRAYIRNCKDENNYS